MIDISIDLQTATDWVDAALNITRDNTEDLLDRAFDGMFREAPESGSGGGPDGAPMDAPEGGPDEIDPRLKLLEEGEGEEGGGESEGDGTR